jgi:hypothetical protein
VKLHHVGVRVGQRQSRSDREQDRSRRNDKRCRSADRRAALASSPVGPLADQAILPVDPGFILEPDFDRRRLGDSFEMSLQRAWEAFLTP